MDEIRIEKINEATDTSILVVPVTNTDNSVDRRVFLQSKNVNIFPCSRRGQFDMQDSAKYYDPEARLNTERTNRLSTSVNGFTDSFIDNFDADAGNLVFTLAGYRVEAKNINIEKIAEALAATDEDIIYAHLSLHTGISLSINDYYTEILYRQSNSSYDKNYIDVTYTSNGITNDFFVGISFTKDANAKDLLAGARLIEHNLPIFHKITGSWELVQTSLLPKIEHGETEDSIKVSGDFTVKHDEQTSFKVTEDKTTITNDFTIKRVSDEGVQTSFEITKHGVGTVNVPLHITKATAVDGVLNSTSATRTKNLIVGELIEGEIFPDEGTIKAKKHIETPTLEATVGIDTPLLNVTNDGNGQANIDNAEIKGALEVIGDTMLQGLSASATNLGSLTVNGDTTLKGKTAISNDLDITGTATSSSSKTGAAEAASLKVTGESNLGSVNAKKVTANEVYLEDASKAFLCQVPALEVVHLTATDTYRLRFKFGKPITIIEE